MKDQEQTTKHSQLLKNLHDESNELFNKLSIIHDINNKLEANDDLRCKMDPIEVDLLKMQEKAMDLYQYILSTRITNYLDKQKRVQK